MPYEAKKLVETFSSFSPHEKVWATWINKDEIVERVAEQLGYENEDDNKEVSDVEAQAKALVTEDFMESVFDSINNDDYLWERFNENFSEIVCDLVTERLKQIEEDKELWDTEMEKTK